MMKMMCIVLSSDHVMGNGTWADGEYQVNLEPTSITGDPGKKWCIAVEQLFTSNTIAVGLIITIPTFQLANTYASHPSMNHLALVMIDNPPVLRNVTTTSICSEMAMPMSSWPGRIHVRILDSDGDVAEEIDPRDGELADDPEWTMVLAIFQRD